MKLDGCGITPECSKTSRSLFSELVWNLISFGSDGGILVIIPMVLQIRKTIVLQRIELEKRRGTPLFGGFGSRAPLMGKHGFAEKLQI